MLFKFFFILLQQLVILLISVVIGTKGQGWPLGSPVGLYGGGLVGGINENQIRQRIGNFNSSNSLFFLLLLNLVFDFQNILYFCFAFIHLR